MWVQVPIGRGTLSWDMLSSCNTRMHEFIARCLPAATPGGRMHSPQQRMTQQCLPNYFALIVSMLTVGEATSAMDSLCLCKSHWTLLMCIRVGILIHSSFNARVPILPALPHGTEALWKCRWIWDCWIDAFYSLDALPYSVWWLVVKLTADNFYANLVIVIARMQSLSLMLIFCRMLFIAGTFLFWLSGLLFQS